MPDHAGDMPAFAGDMPDVSFMRNQEVYHSIFHTFRA